MHYFEVNIIILATFCQKKPTFPTYSTEVVKLKVSKLKYHFAVKPADKAFDKFVNEYLVVEEILW